MAESYTDDALNAIAADPNHVHDRLRLWPAIERLRKERDEARRVAAALADYYHSGQTGMDGVEVWDAAATAVKWHPAYGEVTHG